MRDLEESLGRGTARVHHALGDTLSMEVGELLGQLVILEQDWPPRADRERVVVVIYRMALVIGPLDAVERRVRRVLWWKQTSA